MPITIDGTGTITGATTLASTVASPTFTTPALGTPASGNLANCTGAITSGTAQASTSGTSIDFTGIPSGVKRVTVMFNGVSANGTSNWLVRLGAGSVATTGYLGAGSYCGPSTGGVNSTTGFIIAIGGPTQVMQGSMILTLLDAATNTWVQQCNLGDSSQAFNFFSGGGVTLSGTLDRARITTVNGTDTFDAGSINILYES